MMEKKTPEKAPPTKGEIFDMFYQKRMVVRAGGGTAKQKMTRVAPGNENMKEMEKRVLSNKQLLKYYIKLRDRKTGIAPPPRPS